MKKIILLLLVTLSMANCTKDFESINTNTNEPETVSGDLLLRTSIFNLANYMIGSAFSFNDVMAQYMATYEYNQLDIYNWGSDGRFWGMYDLIQDLRDVRAYGVSAQQPNYEAVGLILETYCYSILTDSYGDVPFSESNRAQEGIITPKYDKQQAIYSAMLNNLKQANDKIDLNATINGDILYQGDMMKWKKFANSLRVRLLMRTAEVSNMGAELQAILDNPAQFPVFESNADAATYFYSGVSPDFAPYSSANGGREYEYFITVPTTHFINTLNKYNDPRIHEWLGYRYQTTEYVGLEPGLDQGDIGRPADYATKDTSFFSQSTKTNSVLMSYSELCFIYAEAAARNMVNADAKTWYDKGVTASFAQWSVDLPADYLTVSAPFDAANLEPLYEQKWLSLYHVGIEAWLDWKRTGRPSFIKAGPGNVNNGLVPVRLMYPSLEQSVNGSNYQSAAQSIGGDDINTRVWWDKP
jgi:hypothetical protein